MKNYDMQLDIGTVGTTASAKSSPSSRLGGELLLHNNDPANNVQFNDDNGSSWFTLGPGQWVKLPWLPLLYLKGSAAGTSYQLLYIVQI
jgi:hypothetical protein